MQERREHDRVLRLDGEDRRRQLQGVYGLEGTEREQVGRRGLVLERERDLERGAFVGRVTYPGCEHGREPAVRSGRGAAAGQRSERGGVYLMVRGEGAHRVDGVGRRDLPALRELRVRLGERELDTLCEGIDSRVARSVRPGHAAAHRTGVTDTVTNQ